MDKYTFGDSQAATDLVEILETEYPNQNLQRYVSKRLNKFREILSQLSKIKRRSYQKYLADLLLKDFRKKTKQNDWPEKVKTFFLNVINTDYKKFIKEN